MIKPLSSKLLQMVVDHLGIVAEATNPPKFLEQVTVGTPAGFDLPLDFRISHAFTEDSTQFAVVCTRMAGDLYLSFCYEQQTSKLTMLLLARARNRGKDRGLPFQSMVDQARVTKKCNTYAEYTKLMKDNIVKGWTLDIATRKWADLQTTGA